MFLASSDRFPPANVGILLALDVDGTLVDSLGRLDEHLMGAAKSAGPDVEVILLTGRPRAGLAPILRAGGFGGPVVCLNGALAFENPESAPSVVRPIEAHVSAELLRGEIVGPGTAAVFAYTHDNWFACGEGGAIHEEARLTECTPRLAREVADLPVDGVLKFTIVLSRAQGARRTIARIGNLFASTLRCERSRSRYIEVTASGVDKGSAFVALSRKYPNAYRIAVGDGSNDLPVFAVVDEAYAVPGAPLAVRRAAKGVIGRSVDSLSQILIAARLRRGRRQP